MARAMIVAIDEKPRLSTVARVANLVKNYHMEEVVIPALAGVTLDFEEGDFIALMGPSGSGKSTLLNLLGCLDRCTTGHYFLGHKDVADIDDNELSQVRSRYLGFVFQSYNLLPQYTVVENIEIPLLYQGCRLTEQTRERCIALAEMVGLGQRLHHRPTQLSGGQQQRVAIARALVNDPHVILADEPTGNLDSHTSDEIMRLLRSLTTLVKQLSWLHMSLTSPRGPGEWCGCAMAGSSRTFAITPCHWPRSMR